VDEAVAERYFGLWRSDYSPKPAVVEIERLAGMERNHPVNGFDWIDISPEEYYLFPRENLRRLYPVFCAQYPEEA